MAAKSSLPSTVLDLEAAVLALLGQPVLHHDHRPDVVGALDVAHVEALDAQRRLGQVERVLQRVEGPGPGVVVGRPPQPVADELLLGVLRDRLLQGPLVAPLRHPDRHLRAPQLGTATPRRGRRRRARRGRAPRAGAGRGRLRRRGPRAPVPTSSPGVTSSTLSRTKPLRPTTRPRRTKNTCTAASSSSSAMPITSRSSGRSVTICCFSMALRTLVSRSRRRAARSNSRASAASCICCSSRRTTGSVSPSRKSSSSLDQPVVLARSSISPTHGPAALLDVEQQARPAQARGGVELVVGAGADRERAQQQVERLPDGVGVAVGAEVADALALLAPHDHRPGPLVVER